MLIETLLKKGRLPGVFLLLTLFASQAWSAGAACVMARFNGQTLDYELIVGKSHPSEALDEAGKRLAKRGYDDYYKNLDVRHGQALSYLPHAYVIVIRSEFKNWRGKDNSVMGCGFSAKSYDDAVWEAIRDAQTYYWGWKPDRDKYKIVKKVRY